MHFWSSGRPINAANAERVQRTLAAVRFADRGTASDNRALLLTPQGDGALLRDLLREQAYDRFMETRGTGPGAPDTITRAVVTRRAGATAPDFAGPPLGRAPRALADRSSAGFGVPPTPLARPTLG